LRKFSILTERFKMLAMYSRALLFWLGLFELLADWRGWKGLSWLAPASPRWLLLPSLFMLRGRRASTGQWIVSLALALPPALLIQVAAGSLRHPRLNPLLRLRPGRYDHYTIDRLDMPMREGYLPALHVIPRGGASAVVCVLHGSGCDKTSYAWQLVDTLVGCGLALLLIDMDGHGENPRAQSFPAITENADVAVAWLRERYMQVGLLGVSLGGCVAARAVADGLAVDALVVLEAPPVLRYTQADVYREALALARPYLLDIFHDCTAQALIKAWEYPPIRAAISTWDLIEALDVCGSLAQLTMPLLLIYGASDAIVKPDQAAQVWAALPAGATFHLVPGVSHLTMILTPQVLELLGAWLAEILQARAVC
jgi:pimeloyl-ACP methyl ester carboxylesterase